MHGVSEGRPPELNLDTEKKLLGGVLKAIQSGLVQSAHDVSEGTCRAGGERISGALGRACNGQPICVTT